MSKKSLLKEFVNFNLFLAVLCILVSAQMAVTMPSAEDNSPWSPNQFKNNINVKINKPLGKISAVKIKQTSSSATIFRPKQTMPRFAHREPQWIPGNDQMQIESAPNGRYGVFGDLGYQFKRYNKGFDLTTLVAVSLVSALLGALTFSVVDGGAAGKSIGNSLSLLNLIDAESVAKMLSSLGDWASDKVKDEVGKNGETTVDGNNNSNYNISSTKPAPIRTSRSASGTDMSAKTSEGILRWYHAYKKDPNQLRCIQKLICETLASSACAARSINSEIGGTVMNLVKYFVGSAGNVSDLITETVGNPSKCSKLTQYDFCNEDDLSLDVKPTPEIAATPIPAPGFNLSSITPRLRRI